MFKHRTLLAFITVVVAWGGTAAAVSDAELKELLQRASEAKRATERWDARSLARMTHPALAAAVGGQQRLLERTEALMARTQAQGVKILEISMEKPRCEQVPGHLLCFIPKRTKVRVGDQVASERSFIVAVRDQETSNEWRFVDGAVERDSPGALRQFLPWLPASVKLPETSLTVSQ